MLCVNCKKNAAVVFIKKIDPVKRTESTDGYCLKCVSELGLAPVDEVLKDMGITPEQAEAMSHGMNDFMSQLEMGGDEDGSEFGSPLVMMGNLPEFFGGLGKSDDNGSYEGKGGTQTATKQKKKEKKRILDVYGTNLTLKAKSGLIDRIIGRDAEISRVVQILNRRSKNNPVLLGEPGVGKTAIAEGLAVRIAEKRVPTKLYNKEIYLLDFTAIVAGTQFRGQFEARLKKILEEAKELGNVILVIDELHNIVGAGDAEGAMSAANILKPALARGDVQIIGATTLNEYRKHIEKDTALERRFQPVMVEEPSVADSVEILKGIRDYYEKYHYVKISDEVIRQAVLMSERYITDRFLPDKAIDVIDEAGSKVNLGNKSLVKLTQLQEQLRQVQLEKDSAVSSDSTENYQRAAELKAQECLLIEKINALDAEGIDIALTVEDVAAVIEDWTKIPVKSITEAESAKLLDLENRIHRHVIGQEEAVSLISQAIRRNRARLSKVRRPVSFVFVGPTGVGKTELAKTLAKVMFDNEEAMIRVDMSEYMEKHTVSKLIGAPPGYVGYDEAGQLTEKIRRKPYSIILLDEIEKAHPDVFNILLQILDDGRVADSHGRIVNFENAIIIMTSNAGSDLRSSSYGFNKTENENMKNKVESAMRDIFRPEFLNRIDEVVTFNQLTKEELSRIIDLMIFDLTEELFGRDIVFTMTKEAKDLILQQGYDPKFGARPLRRTIEKLVQNPVAEMMLRGEIPQHSKLLADASEEKIRIQVVQ
ncbi:MAG: ATP-dependent Clp protease ATP-binding subunit [Ruminococcaceae bacterium]|nr:ATP-dependent Clp protease ATP-binding subunit [Oscillospiraceae bacterium]